MEKLQIDIKPKLVSDYRKAPFDIAKKELESHKPRFLVCSIADLTDLRLQEGSASDVSQEGSSVTSGILYIPIKYFSNGNLRNRAKLLPYSPIMHLPEKATAAHRAGLEFCLMGNEFEKAMQESIDFPELYDDGRILGIPGIDLDSFEKEEFCIRMFEGVERANAYRKFLVLKIKPAYKKLNKLPIWLLNEDYVNSQPYPFIRQVYFDCLDNGSAIV